jgi:nucleoside-diphosphate-sugar epimerase
MATVLVTGGPGFIGRRVVRRFQRAGWDVTSFSLPGEALDPSWPDPVRMVHGDLSDPVAVARAARGADLCIHLAAVVGVPGEYERQWRIIAEGTANVGEAMAAQGGRLVVASSIAVYGTNIQTRHCHEDDGFGPWAGAYGRAKQGQEQKALDVAARTGMPLTLVRPANVYGLGGSSAWGDRLIETLRQTGGAVVGDADRNNAGLTYVENLADALFLAGTHPAAVGRTYNVCDGEAISWRRFMDDMATLAGMPPPPAWPLEPLMEMIRANEDPPGLIGPKDPNLPMLEGLNLVGFDNRIDSQRIRTELGWAPRMTYADAMAEMRQQAGRSARPV